MGRNTQLSIEDDNGRQLAIYKVNYGSKLFFKDGDVEKKEKVAEWDPYTLPVIAKLEYSKLYGLNGRKFFNRNIR